MIKYLGKTKRDQWECFSWLFVLNDQTFEYFTGLAHATKTDRFRKPSSIKNKKTIRDGDLYVHVPRLKDLLYALATGAQLASDSFEDFCSNLGYDTDSRKALETYLKCQESGHKLRRVLKSNNAIERINAWEL